MKSQITRVIIYSLLLVPIVACQKKTVERIPENVLAKDTLTEGQERIAALHKEIAGILEKVYYNDSAYWEVNAGIFSGYYIDERVLLYDLLFPESSAMYNSQKFRSVSNFTGVFARVFFTVMGEGNYPLLKQALARPIPKKPTVSSELVLPERKELFNLQQPLLNAAIYFPYSENFSTSRIVNLQKPTIVAATKDADSATGSSPYACLEPQKPMCYRIVWVNDNYALSSPTHIITQGVERVSGVYPVPVSNNVNRVYNGWSRLTRQMDKLFSITGNGGGSEVKICRINGYLKTKDDQVENFDGDIVTAYFSRGDIRKKRWKRIYSVWDPNWNYQNIEQCYAVYEEDTKGEATIDGSLITTVNLPGNPSTGKTTGEIGFKITVPTQDEILTQRNIDRSSYFKSAGVNQGYGLHPDSDDFLPAGLDWPVYDGGAVWNHTMPFQVY